MLVVGGGGYVAKKPKVPAKAFQVTTINRMLVRAGLNPELVDVFSLVDSTLSIPENIAIVKEYVGASVRAKDTKLRESGEGYDDFSEMYDNLGDEFEKRLRLEEQAEKLTLEQKTELLEMGESYNEVESINRGYLRAITDLEKEVTELKAGATRFKAEAEAVVREAEERPLEKPPEELAPEPEPEPEVEVEEVGLAEDYRGFSIEDLYAWSKDSAATKFERYVAEKVLKEREDELNGRYECPDHKRVLLTLVDVVEDVYLPQYNIEMLMCPVDGRYYWVDEAGKLKRVPKDYKRWLHKIVYERQRKLGVAAPPPEPKEKEVTIKDMMAMLKPELEDFALNIDEPTVEAAKLFYARGVWNDAWGTQIAYGMTPQYLSGRNKEAFMDLAIEYRGGLGDCTKPTMYRYGIWSQDWGDPRDFKLPAVPKGAEIKDIFYIW